MKSKSALYLILTFLFMQPAFSQIQSGEITYKVQPPKEFGQYTDTTTVMMKDDKIKGFFKKMYHDFKIGAPALNLVLKFNKEESLFDRPSSMSNDNGIDLKEVAGWAGVSGKYYTNTVENIGIHQVKWNGRVVRIKKKLNQVDWRLQDETKCIQGYTCKKATARLEFSDNRHIDLVAWFAPELPFQFGPLGYSGLPGMILGLNENHTYFYADQVVLSEKQKTVNKPMKGKIISEENYLKQLEASYQRGKQRYEANHK